MRGSVEELTSIAVDCGPQVHKDLGPRLLESAYEWVLSHVLTERGLALETQAIIPITHDGLKIDQGLRAEIIVEGKLLIEPKSVERLMLVRGKQVLTYLRLINLPIGLLMNFSSETFREGLKRIVNNHQRTETSTL